MCPTRSRPTRRADAEDLPAWLRAVLARHDGRYGAQPALGMALVHQFTGVRVERTPAVTNPTIVHRILDPVLQLPVSAEELVRLELPTPGTVADVRSATPRARWQVAHWAASQAVHAARLHGAPEIADFLRQTRAPRVMTPQLSALRATVERHLWAVELAVISPEGTEADRREVGPAGRRYWAVQSLAYLAQADDVTAALGAVHCADVVLDDRSDPDPGTDSWFVRDARLALRTPEQT